MKVQDHPTSGQVARFRSCPAWPTTSERGLMFPSCPSASSLSNPNVQQKTPTNNRNSNTNNNNGNNVVFKKRGTVM